MLLIECPWCGPRDDSEFQYGGEAHKRRPPAPEHVSDEIWADYLFHNQNPKGLYLERWRHSAGCRRWFNVARNTVSHAVIEVYLVGELPKDAAARAVYDQNWRRQNEADADSAAATAASAAAEETGA